MDITETLSFSLKDEWYYPTRRAYAGDVIYSEGMAGDHVYLIKEGAVDLCLVREEKQVVVATLRKGQCFGMMPQLLSGRRTAKAVARGYCEFHVIDAGEFDQMIEQTPRLVRAVLSSLAKRVVAASELVATRVNYQPELLVYANLLHLLGAASQPTAKLAQRRGDQAVLASPLLHEVLAAGRSILGHSEPHIRHRLDNMVALHLIRIEDEKGSGKRVYFNRETLVARTRQLAREQQDHGKVEFEYIDAGELAEMVEVDRAKLLAKLAQGDFADDLFTFRKSEVMRLLNEKGRKFFIERKIKRPEDFSDIADIEFADQKSVYEVLTKYDVFDLAKVVRANDDAAVKEKILASLPRTKREDLEQEISSLDRFDPIEAARIAQRVIDQVKERMLKAA